MDPASHISVILDLSPTQWLLSSQPTNPHPLSFKTFLSQTLAFLNSHIALKHENTLAVYGALPGKRFVVPYIFMHKSLDIGDISSVLLYSSTEPRSENDDDYSDPNAYTPFKIVDHAVTNRIVEELDALPDVEEEGQHSIASTFNY